MCSLISSCIYICCTLCLKNDTDVAYYNFDADEPILIIFGRHVAEWHAIKWWFVIPHLLTNVSALPGETRTPGFVSFHSCCILCRKNEIARREKIFADCTSQYDLIVSKKLLKFVNSVENIASQSSVIVVLYSGQHTQWVLGCILSLGRYGMISIRNESWGVFSVYDAVEWRTDPMSPGVYSLYTSPWNEQQTQSVLGCILSAQRYIVVNTPNESSGVFSLYGAMEWLTYLMSPGVYSLCTSLWNEQPTQSVLGCIPPAQRYRVVNTPNESSGVFSLYGAMDWLTYLMSKAHDFPRRKMQFSAADFCIFRGVPRRDQNVGLKH